MRPALLLSALLIALAPAALAAPPAKPSAKSAPVARKPALPFLEDDLGRALALAKERRLPVFIEGWAPW
jgi:hypothetical protein